MSFILISVKPLKQSPTSSFSLKLKRYAFDGWTVQWMRNCLESDTQRLVVSGSVSRWTSVKPLWGLRPVLFNDFINDIEKSSETLSKFKDGTKLSGAFYTPEGQETHARIRNMAKSRDQVQGPELD